MCIDSLASAGNVQTSAGDGKQAYVSVCGPLVSDVSMPDIDACARGSSFCIIDDANPVSCRIHLISGKRELLIIYN